MKLTLEIQNQQELQLILQYLKLLPSVRVISTPVVQPNSSVSSGPKKDFSKYWGSINTGMSVEEIGEKLNKMRDESEWERRI